MSKYTIKKWIILHLSVEKRGFKSKFDFTIIILLIFKRLKTGCQWREFPIEVYFKENEISWKTVYYYFNKWSKDGNFRQVWINLLPENHKKLDLSSVQLDGSHTKCRLGGQSVEFQARKMAKITNSVFLADNFGQILVFGSPKSGNFHYLNDIETILTEILRLWEEAKIEYKGLFLNSDAGFDSKKFR